MQMGGSQRYREDREGGTEPPGKSSSMLGPWVGTSTLHSYLPYAKPSPRAVSMPGTMPATLTTAVNKPDLAPIMGKHRHSTHSLGQRLQTGG